MVTTVKFDALTPLHPPLITVIKPVDAPAGTVALISPELTTVNELADIPLNFTSVTPVKLLPFIAITAPEGPLAGEKDVTTGALTTVTPITFDCDGQLAGTLGIPMVHELIVPTSDEALSYAYNDQFPFGFIVPTPSDANVVLLVAIPVQPVTVNVAELGLYKPVYGAPVAGSTIVALSAKTVLVKLSPLDPNKFDKPSLSPAGD